MKRFLTRIAAAFNEAASASGSESREDPIHGEMGGLAAHPDARPSRGDTLPGLLLRTGLRLPRRLDLAFDRHLVGEGWHDSEMADALPFRWMGMAETATVWIAVDRSVDLAVDLDIYLIIKPEFADQIRVAVGEPPKPMAYERTAAGLSFVLPRVPDHIGPTRITLQAVGLVPGADPRRLSLACSHLRLRPLDAGLAEDGQLVLRTMLSRHLPDRDAAARAAEAGGRCEVQPLG